MNTRFLYLLTVILVIINGCGLVHELKFTDSVKAVEIGMTKRQVLELCGNPKAEIYSGILTGLYYRSKTGIAKGLSGDNKPIDHLVVISSEDVVIKIENISLFIQEETNYKIIGKRKIDIEKLCTYYNNSENTLTFCSVLHE